MGTCCSCFDGALSSNSGNVHQHKYYKTDSTVRGLALEAGGGGHKFEDVYEYVDKKLGAGASGEIVMAKPKNRGSRVLRSKTNEKGFVAVKTLRTKGVNTAKVQRMMQELEIFMTTDHMNICRLLRAFEESDQVLLIMEYCEGGSLSERLMKENYFKEDVTKKLSVQILHAVHYCHNHTRGHICHRDLKHANFVFADAEPDSVLKLVDFGLSTVLTDSHQYAEGFQGTIFYMAPEVIEHKAGYDHKVDMWSIGVIIYYMLCGEAPFLAETIPATKRLILEGKYKEMKGGPWSDVNDDAKEFLKLLFKVAPKGRPFCDEMLAHKWLKDHQKHDDIMGKQFWRQATQDVSKLSTVERLESAFLVFAQGVKRDEIAAKIEEEFRILDLDEDGMLSPDEITTVMTKAGIDASVTKEFIRKLDFDGDSKITYSEFLVCTQQLKASQDQSAEIFDTIDQDRSGHVTRRELEDALGTTFQGKATSRILDELDLDKDGMISKKEWTEHASRLNR